MPAGARGNDALRRLLVVLAGQRASGSRDCRAALSSSRDRSGNRKREENLATDLALQDSEPRHRPLPRSWLSSAQLRLLLAVLGLAAGLGNLALNLTSDVEPPFVFTPYLGLLVGWSFIAGGLIAWSRRADTTERRIGVLMVATGFAWFTAGLTRLEWWILPTLGSALSGLWTGLAICLLLVFPQGRLRSRIDRLLVAAVIVDTVLLQLDRPSLLDDHGDGSLKRLRDLAERPGGELARDRIPGAARRDRGHDARSLRGAVAVGDASASPSAHPGLPGGLGDDAALRDDDPRQPHVGRIASGPG